MTVLARARWTLRQSAFGLCLLAALLTANAIRPAYRVDESTWDLLSVWNDNDMIAAAINRVAPFREAVHAPEAIQFAAGRLPHPGLESSYAAELNVSPGLITSLNVVPQSEIDERIRRGWFAAVWIDPDDSRFQAAALSRVYDRRTLLCTIYGYGYLWWKSPSGVRQPNRP